MAALTLGGVRDRISPPVRTGLFQFAPLTGTRTVAAMPWIIDFLPPAPYARRMLRNVAVVALDEVAAFELGVLCEVFGTDRQADGFPTYRFDVCAVEGRPVRTRSGFHLTPTADLAPVEVADLVAVPAHAGGPVPEPVLAALRRAADRGAYVLSVCSGAFVLGAAGLLDGRECTTHWRHVDDLQRRHPLARVRCNSLYVQDGRLLTSAGTAAGIDACLHLVRQEHGSEVATRLARRMVVPPHRDGGQAQYVEAPIPRDPGHPPWSRCSPG
jgi:transcriptional regulator GlxA family with amidase domain